MTNTDYTHNTGQMSALNADANDEGNDKKKKAVDCIAVKQTLKKAPRG